MKIILLKSTKIGGELVPPGEEEIEVSQEIGDSLISQGIAKDANEKETVIVKDETLSLEIEELEEENRSKTLEIDTLKELLKVSIDSAKGTIPDGAETYVEMDLTK